ncbi:MAG: hypothetical protein U0798_21575 [Gemmataceae bacterium]
MPKSLGVATILTPNKMLPDPVDHDAGRRRVLVTDQPIRQCGTGGIRGIGC